MPWIQLTLHIDKNRHQQSEDAMLEAGALSVTYKDAEDKPVLEPLPGETRLWEKLIITGLFEADTNTEQLQAHIRQQLGDDIPLRVEALEDKDWVRAWMDDYKPMQFGERLWVCPKHLPPPEPDAINLMLDPGLAFGTGTHPTTALCLQWLDAHELQNKTLLDFGCGSGVLAIAALLLGAEHCDATDIDPQALQASMDNAIANQVEDKLNVMLPEDMAAKQKQSQYDIVLANILAGPLTELAPRLAACTRSGGDIVLSGILESQADDIMQAYRPWFELEPPALQDEWIRICGRKKESP